MCPPLAVLYGPSCPLNEALVSPFSRWAAGLREGLFVGVLLGMDLVVQELLSQFISIVNLQLHVDAKKMKISMHVDKVWCSDSRLCPEIY